MRFHYVLISMFLFSFGSFTADVSAQCTIDIWNPYGDYATVSLGASFPLFWKATGCGNGFTYNITIYDQYGGIIDNSNGVMNSETTYNRVGTTVYPLGLHTATIVTPLGASDSTHYYVSGYVPPPTYPPYLPPTREPTVLIAEAGPPKTVTIGETVLFDGSGSTSTSPITSYVWDFGDGKAGYGKTATHVYSSADSFIVILTIIDNHGVTVKDTTSVTVRNPALPPIARMSGDKTAKKNEESMFDGAGSLDSDGTIVSYRWDFGDGTSGAGSLVSHVYLREGSFTVTLTVTDNSGLSSSAAFPVLVEASSIPPRAILKMTLQANEGEAVMFDALSSEGQGLRYRWSFGDGTEGQGATAVHVYTGAASYIVTLTVTSREGLSDTVQSPITIKEKGLFKGRYDILILVGFGLVIIIALIFLLLYFLRR
jgi:PKD repeat protein